MTDNPHRRAQGVLFLVPATLGGVNILFGVTEVSNSLILMWLGLVGAAVMFYET